jgi:hypothetical protein
MEPWVGAKPQPAPLQGMNGGKLVIGFCENTMRRRGSEVEPCCLQYFVYRTP